MRSDQGLRRVRGSQARSAPFRPLTSSHVRSRRFTRHLFQDCYKNGSQSHQSEDRIALRSSAPEPGAERQELSIQSVVLPHGMGLVNVIAAERGTTDQMSPDCAAVPPMVPRRRDVALREARLAPSTSCLLVAIACPHSRGPGLNVGTATHVCELGRESWRGTAGALQVPLARAMPSSTPAHGAGWRPTPESGRSPKRRSGARWPRESRTWQSFARSRSRSTRRSKG